MCMGTSRGCCKRRCKKKNNTILVIDLYKYFPLLMLTITDFLFPRKCLIFTLNFKIIVFTCS